MTERHCQRCDKTMGGTDRRFRCCGCDRLTCFRCQTTTHRTSECHDCRKAREEKARKAREDKFRAEGRLTWARKEGFC